MTIKLIENLTGGLNNVADPKLLADNQVKSCMNYEILGDGALTKRKDPAVYIEGLDTRVNAIYTSVITMSEPYYPHNTVLNSAVDVVPPVYIVFGIVSGTYEMYVFHYDATAGWSETQVLTSVTFTSSSDVKFFIGSTRVIVTDGVNPAMYITVDEDGNIVSGNLGILAPTNKVDIDEITAFNLNDFEENSTNTYLSLPGLCQVVYTAVTEEGAESNPSPISLTHNMQWFKLDADNVDERWIDRIPIKNLSIPVASADIVAKLKYFNVYYRLIKFSEGATPSTFEFSQQFEIIDKTNTSGTTGNNHTLTVQVSAGEYASYENDVAPIAKYGAELGGVTVVANTKSKVKFPFEFEKFVKIQLNNQDNTTKADAVIRIEISDAGITDLTLADYMSGTPPNANLDSTKLKHIRFFDSDLTTMLPCVVHNDLTTTVWHCYVRIPQIPASSVYTIYLAWTLAPFTGYDGVSSGYQTFEYGRFFEENNDTWTGQEVFKPLKVMDDNSIICSPMDIEMSATEVYNKADNTFNGTLTDASWVGAGGQTAALAEFNRTIGNNCVQLADDKTAEISFGDSNLTELPDTGYAFGWIKYNGDNLQNAAAGTNVICQHDVVNDISFNIHEDGAENYYFAVLTVTDGTTATTIAAGHASVYYSYFVLVSWDVTNQKVSFIVVQPSGDTLWGDELSGLTLDTGTYTGFKLGVNSTANAVNLMFFDQWQVIHGVYLSGDNTADKNLAHNLANFMPAWENMVGYDYSTENNNITFGGTESLSEDENFNRFKWAAINGINFPDLYFKDVDEPIKGLIPAPSFLRFEYQNTFIIYTRNDVWRFILDGSADTWSLSAKSLIQEQKQFGLLSPRSLAISGTAVFWLSEKGVIMWDSEGLKLISYKRVSVTLDENAIGWHCPIRNQYILTKTDGTCYVYHIDDDKWTMFDNFALANYKAFVSLSEGQTVDNLNLMLYTTGGVPSITKYPGGTSTSRDAYVETKEFYINDGAFKRIKLIHDAGTPANMTVLTTTKKRVGSTQVEEYDTKSGIISNQWRGITPNAERGSSASFKMTSTGATTSVIRQFLFEIKPIDRME